jgi:hypothetical protein
MWSKAESALKIAKTEDQKRIAKAMAIISIVGDDQLKPTALHIRTSLLMDDETFMREASELSKLHVLTKRDVSDVCIFNSHRCRHPEKQLPTTYRLSCPRSTVVKYYPWLPILGMCFQGNTTTPSR